jgi:acyl-CoA reductase-like NAD-dependent aldehyde dehydrogenase
MMELILPGGSLMALLLWLYRRQKKVRVFPDSRDTKHRALSVVERMAELSKMKSLIMNRRDSIVERVMVEVGKSRTDALIAEIIGSVDWIHWLERHAERWLAPEHVKTPITLLGK